MELALGPSAPLWGPYMRTLPEWIADSAMTGWEGEERAAFSGSYFHYFADAKVRQALI
jgi:hypothetical protein